MKYIDKVRKSLSAYTLERIEYEYRYTNSSVKDIIRRYNLQIPARLLVDLLPLIPTKHICPYCQIKLVRRVSRTSTSLPFCNKCGHIQTENCMCPECLKKRETESLELRETQIAAIESKEAKLEQTWLLPRNPANLSLLTKEHRILLSIILLWKGVHRTNGEYCLEDVFMNYESLCPDLQTLESILTNLMHSGILILDNDLSFDQLEAFNPKSNTLSGIIFFNYRINVNPHDELTLQEIIYEHYWLSYEEFTYWWKWITLAEIKSYLSFCSNREGIELSIGQKHIETLEDMLQKCSLALCKRIVCGVCSNTGTRISKGKITALNGKKWLHMNLKFWMNKYAEGEWSYDSSKYTPYITSSAADYIYNKLLLLGKNLHFHALSEAPELYEKYKEAFERANK